MFICCKEENKKVEILICKKFIEKILKIEHKKIKCSFFIEASGVGRDKNQTLHFTELLSVVQFTRNSSLLVCML